MNDIDARAREAQGLWSEGDRALTQGELAGAYRCYTDAHDRVTDCPELHRLAHQKLREVNKLNGRRGEYLTDCFLLAAAPFGIFEFLAIFFRSKVAGTANCKRAA